MQKNRQQNYTTIFLQIQPGAEFCHSPAIICPFAIYHSRAIIAWPVHGILLK
jgi:hypothetical protein